MDTHTHTRRLIKWARNWWNDNPQLITEDERMVTICVWYVAQISSRRCRVDYNNIPPPEIPP